MKDPTHTHVFCAGIELPMCSCKYGAPMGRESLVQGSYRPGIRMHMVRLRFVDGAYDAGGAYWGCGNPIYWAVSDRDEGEFRFVGCYGDAFTDRIQIFVRAKSREDAARQVVDCLPGCRVLRAKIGGRS